MITVSFKPVKGNSDELYINLSSGWSKKIKKSEFKSFVVQYLLSSDHRVFIDEFTELLLSEISSCFTAEGYETNHILQNLKNFQFNKYMCSILKIS